jgi:SpoVK/Ycf46/Vps4 family AAA+-type ATPase
MLVLVTNRAWDLDAALLDRMDTVIELEPPGREERRQLLDLFLDKYM